MARQDKRGWLLLKTWEHRYLIRWENLEAFCSLVRCRLERIVENDHRDARPRMKSSVEGKEYKSVNKNELYLFFDESSRHRLVAVTNGKCSPSQMGDGLRVK